MISSDVMIVDRMRPKQEFHKFYYNQSH